MKLTLKEPLQPRYLFINPLTNTVHLLMPLMSGTDIGLDNTCKSVYSLQEFFGLMGANKQADALSELASYKDALTWDLKYLQDPAECARKTDRLAQIEYYFSILTRIQKHSSVIQPLTSVFPRYPEPLERLMNSEESNLHSIILRPKEQDIQLRTTAITPVFSLPHDGYNEAGARIDNPSLAYETLINRYKNFVFKPKSEEELIARVVARLGDAVVDFEQIRDILADESSRYLGIEDIRFDKTQATQLAASVDVTQAYIDEQMGFDAENLATPEQYIEALLGYCAPNLFDVTEFSPFDTINQPSQEKKEEILSILTQLFLAELNISYRARELTKANFGEILEDKPELMNELAEQVKLSLTEGCSVEEALIVYIQSHAQEFQITNPLSEEAVTAVKKRFNAHYQTIKESPHFDEFLFLSEKPGTFVTRSNFITTHFARFAYAGFFPLLDKYMRAFAQQVCEDFDTVPKPQNTLSHQNAPAVTEVEVDLSLMDNQALQAMYDGIASYQDPEIKKALLTQFERECPDFSFILRINANAFLQHVAYGEQDEAEELLKKDPLLAQKLLRANNIPFTDYSGRTFRCTAYEYAYWARDSHMQRMLEKYICQDDETRLLILNRVRDIETLEKSTGLFGFQATFKKNKGLDYTTKNEHGEIVHHNDTHFSLQPLMDAIRHYCVSYCRYRDEYRSDHPGLRVHGLYSNHKKILNDIWRKKVGGAQRQVPAHIAHEYCHRGRSLKDVVGNEGLLDDDKPGNLKRRLEFLNSNTGNSDLWFTPGGHLNKSGLGFSFAITQGKMWSGVYGVEREAGNDELLNGSVAKRFLLYLQGLAVIDEVRTRDLVKSHKHLGKPALFDYVHERLLTHSKTKNSILNDFEQALKKCNSNEDIIEQKARFGVEYKQLNSHRFSFWSKAKTRSAIAFDNLVAEREEQLKLSS